MKNLGSPEAWPDKDYWEALGRFVDAFARAEYFVQSALFRYAGVSARVGRAVFSGVNIVNGMSFIRRLAETADFTEERRASLDEIFSQLAVITKARNDILHFGTWPDENGGFVVRDLKADPAGEKFNRRVVSVEVLKEMAGDLFLINMALMHDHCRPDRPLKDVPIESRDLKRAFLYRPTPHSRASNKNRPRRQTLEDPTHPSRQ